MPGLIDAHVHVTDHDVSPARLQELPPSWVALRAAKLMREMLFRGFTSIRDAAGADSGLATAVEQELITRTEVVSLRARPEPDRRAW